MLKTITDRARYRGIQEGHRLPWGYGPVMYDPARQCMLMAPIPVNLVLQVGWWLVGRVRTKWWLRELYNAYELGRQDEKAAISRKKLYEAFAELKGEEEPWNSIRFPSEPDRR